MYGAQVIGLLPVAGFAERLHGLPKYLLPCPGGFLLRRHIAAMQQVGISRIYVGAGAHNYRIVEDYADGAQVLVCSSRSARETLLDSVRLDGSVFRPAVMGLPDSFWDDDTLYTRMIEALDGADLVLGLFKTRREQRPALTMCDVYQDGGRLNVTRAVLRPGENHEALTWPYAFGVMAWLPAFWAVLQYVNCEVWECIQIAIDAGLRVIGIEAKGIYTDCGTATEYFRLAANWR